MSFEEIVTLVLSSLGAAARITMLPLAAFDAINKAWREDDPQLISMQNKNLVDAFARLVQFCKLSRNLAEARALHAQIAQSEASQDAYLNNLLIGMYGSCGCTADARLVFDRLQGANLFSWNFMLSAYIGNGQVLEAASMFRKMPQRDIVSWNTMMAGFSQKGCVEQCQEMFHLMPERNVISWTSAVAAFAQNGHLHQAQKLFQLMPQRNSVSFSVIMQALAHHGKVSEARSLFDQMEERSCITWNTMLNVYAERGDLLRARETLQKMPLHNRTVWTAMFLAYSRSKHLEEAKEMFDQMPERDVVAWNALMQAYAEQGHLQEAEAMANRLPLCSIWSFNSMLTAYAQAGHLDQASHLFERMVERDMVAWTTMILGCAGNQRDRMALQHFQAMILEGIDPDEVTLLGVLSACNHLGMLEEGRSYFRLMIWDLGLNPGMEHYNCIIDLFGRLGQMKDAEDLLQNMPFVPDVVANCALLGACRTHGDVEPAALAAEMDFDQESSPYLLLSNAAISI